SLDGHGVAAQVGKLDRHARTLARPVRMGPQLAAEVANQRLDDEQTETGAASAPHRLVVYPIEAFEDALDRAAGDAHAPVGDLDDHALVALFCAHVDGGGRI